MLAERIRGAVAALSIPIDERSVSVTVSIGVASVDEIDPSAEPTALIALADARLYRAKGAGRNRVEHDLGEPSPPTTSGAG